MKKKYSEQIGEFPEYKENSRVVFGEPGKNQVGITLTYYGDDEYYALEFMLPQPTRRSDGTWCQATSALIIVPKTNELIITDPNTLPGEKWKFKNPENVKIEKKVDYTRPREKVIYDD